MRAFLAVLAVVWTLLLASIAYDLRTLNHAVGWMRPSSARSGPFGLVSGRAPVGETREQRRERYKRESDAAYEDFIDRMLATGLVDARELPSKSPRAREQPRPADQKPSPEK